MLTEPTRDRQWAYDFVLALVVAVVVTLPYRGGYGLMVPALSSLLALTLALRRIVPSLAVTLAVIACAGQLLRTNEPTASIVVVPLLVYSVARWTTGSLGRVTIALAVIGSVLGPLRWSVTYPIDSANLLYAAIMMMASLAGVSACYIFGRRRRELVENEAHRQRAEAERQRLMRAEQQQRERTVTVEERSRIARELHDIVAHSLSVIVVQAEGGRAVAAKRPERAADVLGTIAETSREALEEMRRMVQLLRSGNAEPEQATYLPTPGLAELPELVRKTSDIAQLTTFGAIPSVNRALGLSAYRIVQESLTNVLKHAGPGAVARVTVAHTAEAIEIEVSDDGRGAQAASDGLGHGLQGMRERVALHGGSLSAQPRPEGGFVVRARLPYAQEPSIPRPVSPLTRPSENAHRGWVA